MLESEKFMGALMYTAERGVRAHSPLQGGDEGFDSPPRSMGRVV